MPTRHDDRAQVHVRRKARDAARQAERRAEARQTGVPLGHALDAVLVDAIAMMLEGRLTGDPVRRAFEIGLHGALAARGIGASRTLAVRLQARLRPGHGLRARQLERKIEAMCL